MKNIIGLALALLLVLASGCARTKMMVRQIYDYTPADVFNYKIIDQAKVTEKGLRIFKDRLNAKLAEEGLLSSDANKIIEIKFTNYSVRHGAARSLVGVMAGIDNITSAVQVKDTITGEVVGKMKVIFENNSAWGSVRGLIEGHAEKIVSYIKTGKS